MVEAKKTRGPGAQIPSCPEEGYCKTGVFPGAGPGQGSGSCGSEHAPRSALTAGTDS